MYYVHWRWAARNPISMSSLPGWSMNSSVIKARTFGLQRLSRRSFANRPRRRARFPLRRDKIPNDRNNRVRGLWGLNFINDRAKRVRWRADAERLSRLGAPGAIFRSHARFGVHIFGEEGIQCKREVGVRNHEATREEMTKKSHVQCEIVQQYTPLHI